jgi:hypothetical protein
MGATLDCTSGWYARQDWSGAPVSALLRSTGQARSLLVRHWAERTAVIDYIAAYERRLETPEYFDEAHVRALVERIVDRTNDVAASVMNHALAEEGELACGRLDEITAPALVIHGTADPLFPYGHAEALARGIPRAELLPLEGVGHQMPPRPLWTPVIAAMLRHTHFTSPDGLPYPTETATYSTPSDLLTLGLAAMRYPVFRSIVDLRFYHLPKGRGHHQYWWDNTDGLIGSYQGAVGIKTGYTDAARHCLLFEAVRNGRALIGVVLGSPATGPAAAAQDAERMLNWGLRLPRAG